MISVKNVKRVAVVAALVMMAAGAARADTHALWPEDWNDWSDPALWVTVGNPGNAADTHTGMGYGSVAYTYNIGKYEVTAGQYTEFLNKVGGVDTYSLYNTGMSNTSMGSGIARSGGGTVGNPFTYSVDANFVNRPVNYVSFWDACRFANWLHNGQLTGAQGTGTTERGAYTLDGYNDNDGRAIQRNADAKYAVTSEDEWYKAAHYDPNKGGPGIAGYWTYPTSSDTWPDRDMADASGNNANHFLTGDPSDPYPIDSGKYTTVAGEFQNSDSAYGTFDQGGNVWEWNEVLYWENFSYRGVRGGAFDYYVGYMAGASRNNSLPAYEYADTGFRVSEVPEPATMTLLALGGLGMLMGRRAAGR